MLMSVEGVLEFYFLYVNGAACNFLPIFVMFIVEIELESLMCVFRADCMRDGRVAALED